MKFIPSLTDLFIIWFLWLIGLKNVAYEEIKMFLLKKNILPQKMDTSQKYCCVSYVNVKKS